MVKYTCINRNPKGRKTGDCSTRALCGTLGLPWSTVLTLQYEESLKSCYDITSKQVVEQVLKRAGWKKMSQPRKPDGRKYTVGEIDMITSPAQRACGILITVANHHTVVRNDSVEDIWDCRGKCIGNYYVKTGC